MLKYVFIAVLAIMITVFAGCGGGGTNSAVPSVENQTGNTGNIPENPGEPESSGGGTFTISLKVPGPGSSSAKEDLSASVIPWGSKTLKVTITGEFIDTPVVETEDISDGGIHTLTMEDVPVGLNLATIEVLDESSGVMAQRKYGFFMTSGETVSAGPISLGVAIESTGLCNPQVMYIPVGTTIYFENQDYDNSRTVTLNPGSITTGSISQAEHAVQPGTPDVFYSASYTFNTAGEYVYENGFGGDGTDSYKIEVYELPSVTSLEDGDGDVYDSNNYSLPPINFTITGENFGADKDSVEGDVTFYKSFDWVPVGEEGFSDGNAESISLYVYNGTPYVAYPDHANNYKAIVMMHDGAEWISLGNKGFSDDSVGSTSLYLYDGTPYIAYRDAYENSYKATVMMYNGTDWVSVGTPRFSDGEVSDIYLYVYDGTPYVAYRDVENNGATVMMYNGTEWVSVGNKGFSDGVAVYTSLCVYNGTPYVAYRDDANSGKATVMMYDGSNWVSIGNKGFSDEAVACTSLYLYNGTIYVAYIDYAYITNNATVMTYDGSKWISIGNKGFSDGGAWYTSLYVYNGTPYVAYRDDANSGKATVMMYNGTEWISVGNKGFSDERADYTSLYLYEGIPYVAYRDDANSGKATVMKYTTDLIPYTSTITDWTDTQILGNIEIPGGKYRVEVKARGETSTDNVRYYKGQGSYEVEVD